MSKISKEQKAPANKFNLSCAIHKKFIRENFNYFSYLIKLSINEMLKPIESSVRKQKNAPTRYLSFSQRGPFEIGRTTIYCSKFTRPLKKFKIYRLS